MMSHNTEMAYRIQILREVVFPVFWRTMKGFRVLYRIATVLLLLAGCAYAQQTNPSLDALKKYILEKDYPEVFGSTTYKTRIENVLDVDIDNDGAKEIVIQYFPHYRQSAPIVIYKISPDLKVERVTEGLAPGPLQPLSEDYLDAHSLGMAIDFEIPSGKGGLEEVRKIFSQKGMSGFVAYDSFYHVDARKGPQSFIDMRGIKLPSKKHDCSEFEFSRVKQIAVGGLREDAQKNYLAAWVGDEIYVYLIRGISSEGILDKKLWVIKAPAGFNGFEDHQGLTYRSGTTTAVLTLQ